MRTIVVARKLCTRVFLDDVAVSSSFSGGTSPVSWVFCSYARVRCIRVIGVTRITFAVVSLFIWQCDSRYPRRSADTRIQSDATVESHWYSRNGIKVTKLGELRAFLSFFFFHAIICIYTQYTGREWFTRAHHAMHCVLRHVEITSKITWCGNFYLILLIWYFQYILFSWSFKKSYFYYYFLKMIVFFIFTTIFFTGSREH